MTQVHPKSNHLIFDSIKIDKFVACSHTRMIIGRPWIHILFDKNTKKIWSSFIDFDIPAVNTLERLIVASGKELISGREIRIIGTHLFNDNCIVSQEGQWLNLFPGLEIVRLPSVVRSDALTERIWSLFHPKRRVDNKISWQKPHIIGSFRSHKMNRTVEYHSLNECFFYYYLELDASTIRYYVQPVEVSIPVLSMDENKKLWKHVPDVLVFRNGSKPLLYQIKESPEDVGRSFEQCNKRCELMALEQGWAYTVIYPKTLPETVLNNMNYLHGFLRKRRYYQHLMNDVLFKIKYDQPISIGDLAKSFYPRYHPNDVKPLIFHLIAEGKIETDIFLTITSSSLWIGYT